MCHQYLLFAYVIFCWYFSLFFFWLIYLLVFVGIYSWYICCWYFWLIYLWGDLCPPQSECACTPQCSHTQIMEMANCGETEFAFTSLKLFGNSQLFDKGENLLYLKGMKPRRKDYVHKIYLKMKKIRRIFLRCPSHHSGGGSDRTAEPLLISAPRSLEYNLLSISLEYFAPSSSNALYKISF